MDDPPVISLLEARNEALYTCACVDADSEAGPEFLHYLVANIPVGSVGWPSCRNALGLLLLFDRTLHAQGKQADSRAGDVLLSYAAPSKHHGQGVHRYVVAVLEQPQGKRLTAAPPKHRSHFKVQVRWEVCDSGRITGERCLTTR